MAEWFKVLAWKECTVEFFLLRRLKRLRKADLVVDENLVHWLTDQPMMKGQKSSF